MAVLAHLRDLGLRFSVREDQLLVEPKGALTDELRAFIRERKGELLEELARDVPDLSPAQEAARARALAYLRANPSVTRAFHTRFEGDWLVVVLAVRGVGTCELAIPAERAQSAGDYADLVRCLEATEGRA